MSTKNIRLLIVGAMALQFLWLFVMPAGNRLAPRSPEMAQALRAFETNRTPATEAAMWAQVHRDDLRGLRRQEILFGMMLLADVIAIFLFWNYGAKKGAASCEGS